jgi:hypothetical protein
MEGMGPQSPRVLCYVAVSTISVFYLFVAVLCRYCVALSDLFVFVCCLIFVCCLLFDC